ncbi:MAG: PAS domain S-box protein [Candidatus Omnitrophica bacterium]|nr:PAS domain S-box protein [Candidatus Omnitrophota bacterium]
MALIDKSKEELIQEIGLLNKRIAEIENDRKQQQQQQQQQQMLLKNEEFKRLNNRAKEELEREQNLLKSTLNAMTDIFYAFDKNGKFLIWNDTFRKVSGYSDEELHAMKPQDFFTGEDIGRIAASVEIIWKDGVSKETANFVIKDGTRIPYEFTGAVMKDSAGNIMGFSGTGRDLTESRKVEQALHFNMTKLDLALKSSRMGVWQFNIVEGKRIFDDQVCFLLGIDPVTFRGSKDEFLARVHPEDRERITAGLAHTLDTGEIYETDYRVVWTDGSVHYITARGELIRDNNGVAQLISGVIWDITERKQMDDEKSRLLEIIEQSPDFIGTCDLQGNLQYHNKGAKKMVGLPQDADLSQMKYTDMVPAWAAKLVGEEGIPTAISQGVWRGEIALLHQNGKEFPAEETLVVHRDSSGTPKFFSAIMRDLTERKRAEEQLQKSEIWYKTLFNGSPEGILIADAQTKKFSYANTTICKMFGYDQEEILKLGVADIHPKEFWGHVTAEFEAQARGEKTLAVNMPCLSKNGTTFYADISTAVLTLDGKSCLIGFFTDVTKRKEAEDILYKQTRELKIFYDSCMGREERILELKNELAKLRAELGRS